MNAKNWNVVLGISVVVLLGTVVYLLYINQSNEQILAHQTYDVNHSASIKTVNSNQQLPTNSSDMVTSTNSEDGSIVGNTYKNDKYGFEFIFPDNFKPINDPQYIGFANEFEESISLEITPDKFDAKNIQGLYGPVEDAKQVKIGSQIGYKFLEGDAGCGSMRVVTAIGANTLKVSFGACEDGKRDYSEFLYQNDKLITQILSTFKFTK